jgi:hypothetical protein
MSLIQKPILPLRVSRSARRQSGTQLLMHGEANGCTEWRDRIPAGPSRDYLLSLIHNNYATMFLLLPPARGSGRSPYVNIPAAVLEAVVGGIRFGRRVFARAAFAVTMALI